MTTYMDQPAVRAMLDDIGITMTCAGVTTKGLADLVTTSVDGGPMPSPTQALAITITVETGSLPGLTPGAVVLVNTTQFVAIDVAQDGDGALTIAALQRKVV